MYTSFTALDSEEHIHILWSFHIGSTAVHRVYILLLFAAVMWIDIHAMELKAREDPMSCFFTVSYSTLM